MVQENQKNGYMSDEAIIELYWERNEKAISETDKKYKKYLYKIAYNIVHNHPDCEECLNDTYLGTWNAIPPTRPNVFQIFLSKIMRNVAVDKCRENTASKRVPSELLLSLDEVGDSISYNESVEEDEAVAAVVRLLNDYLKALDEREQFIFICRYYYCDKISEIANMLKVSERTVFRALSDMRAELKEKLDKEGVEV